MRRGISKGSTARRAMAVASLLVLVSACSSAKNSAAGAATTTSPSTTSQSSTTAASAPANPATPVWLCRPGTSPDPCVSGLNAEVVAATGAKTLQPASAATSSPFDCFFVYPTVSTEKGPNADLAIQPAETAVAQSEAARFSSVCRVWAPMYRQVTLSSLVSGGVAALDVAYQSLLADWQYYLQHVNGGRPFVLIGHSQGAAMLIRLIEEQIDQDPTVRRQLVAAILAGGNLQVPTGRTVGATFKNIPLCTSTAVDGCAIAYSTFGSEPPADALFGRPGTGVSLQSFQVTKAGQQVACVNPAAIAGGAADLSPYFPASGSVPWVTYPQHYTASCESAGGATWLQVSKVNTPGDTRPVVTASLGPTWGYHVYDVNLALGNLVSDVSALEAAHHQ